MDYSPKLKEAMAEIKAVIDKHDIAAHVLLHEPGYSEFLLAVEPSWSVIHVLDDQIRIRSKLVEDFGGDREAKRAADTATANLLRMFADILSRDGRLFDRLHGLIEESWKPQHGPKTFTPHREN